jgi:hypothetical protein
MLMEKNKSKTGAPNIVIIGAGAVGATLARALIQAGANVSYLVKESNRAQVLRGFDFDPNPKLVDTILNDVDWVVLAVPSNALQSADWLARLIAGASKTMSMLSIAPGFQDRELIIQATGLRPDQVISASVPFLAQLDTSTTPQKLISWRPPLSSVALADGTQERMIEIQKCLEQGGLPAVIKPEFRRDLLIGDLFLRMVVAGLKPVNWNWDEYFKSEWPKHSIAATFEAIPIASRLRGIEEPNPWIVRGLKLILTPTLLRFVLRLIAVLSPIPLEAFLKSHFTKVDAQMRQGLIELSEVGGIDAASHSTKHIEILLAASH